MVKLRVQDRGRHPFSQFKKIKEEYATLIQLLICIRTPILEWCRISFRSKMDANEAFVTKRLEHISKFANFWEDLYDHFIRRIIILLIINISIPAPNIIRKMAMGSKLIY